MRAEAERLAEVLRLCTLLADRALDAQITGRAVPADQAAALAKAARLLQDHSVEWPPLLTQVLHELAGLSGELTSGPEVDPLDSDLQGLARFFCGFRKKDQS
ncbi:hypothetical protein MKK75_21810 [Methylobacterium sp. J-030]|uniref:hypothetical protein n=1 Tax=Methylobacterium sp. J-030 TaxID=2836627 RepID=UPI001FB868AE|nr:hypothetical protein [Methylobacterium sp. J-030]MCJ2071399.1 hypothetical protein [Methylobacterium sp. J-030]